MLTYLYQSEAVIPHRCQCLSAILALRCQSSPELVKGHTVNPQSTIGQSLTTVFLQRCFTRRDLVLRKCTRNCIHGRDKPVSDRKGRKAGKTGPLNLQVLTRDLPN